MTVKLSQENIEAIKRHGEATYPEECGGLLLGTEENGVRLIADVVPLENVRKDSRHNRVQLDPLAYARAEREAGKRGLGVWGYYHSHPDHPAVPSGFDLEHAPFIEWSYLIVSVKSGRAEDVRAWTVSADRSQFIEEFIEEEFT
ncbi:MAG: M67 family metallopeptidase [Acidobacteriota bacterium]